MRVLNASMKSKPAVNRINANYVKTIIKANDSERRWNQMEMLLKWNENAYKIKLKGNEINWKGY